jgi:hypothetical protein
MHILYNSMDGKEKFEFGYLLVLDNFAMIITRIITSNYSIFKTIVSSSHIIVDHVN